MGDQRHHIEDPAIRSLVQAQVIAELRRIADAMERGLLETSAPVAVVTAGTVAETPREEIFDIPPKAAADECHVHISTIERLCRRLWRKGDSRNKRGGRWYLSRRQLDAYKAGKL
jgi:hypothetical protein